jgi:mono/diheme cytochrome c family protein
MHVRSVAGAFCAMLALSTIAACASKSAAPTADIQPQAAKAVAALPEGVTAAMVTVGDSIFHKASCQRCHGMDAKGTERGPNLTDTEWAQIDGTYPEIVRIITEGVPKEKVKMPGAPFAMRARGGVNPALTDEQVRQLAAYVFTISHR